MSQLAQLFPDSPDIGICQNPDPKFRLQQKLVKAAIDKDRPLKEILEESGLQYADLVYRNNDDIHAKAPDFTFSSFESRFSKKIPIVSFFSGAGGLDLGFEKAGFVSKVLVEHHPTFCETLKENFKGAHVIGPPKHSGDVSRTDELKDILRGLGIERNFQGVFIGGPPCQPFSIAANQRFRKSGENFKRTGFMNRANGGLLFDYVDLIIFFKPRAFLIENVPGLLEIDGGAQLRSVYNRLRRAGYHVHEPMILEASRFGVPQYRRRLFIAGSNIGEIDFDIPPQYTKQRCIDHIFDVSDALPNNETRGHSAASIARYMMVDFGQRDKLGRVDRLDPYEPSKTIIAGGSQGGGRSHLHPTIPRTLSPRECARLQTFPDEFFFHGPGARQFNQIGNAVPPLLAAQIAEYVIRPLFEGQ